MADKAEAPAPEKACGAGCDLCYNKQLQGDKPMATTTAPQVQPNEVQPKTTAPVMTPSAIAKVKEIMASQTPVPAGLRLSVVGGGCSGFQYSMAFENGAGMMDKVFEFDGLKVYVDATSLMYLGGAHVDYVETLEGAGFKFENPNVKSTCGCGSSFNV
jgi:iron-sulfur cluster assembly accessory protein